MGASPLLAVGVVAKAFGVSPKTVTSWLNTGVMAGIRTPSGRWRVAQSTVDEALAGRNDR